MRLLGRDALYEFAQKHADSAPHIEAWSAEIKEARWSTPQQLKARYPKASILGKNRVVFNLNGNRYRLLVLLNYTVGLVVVERIGTHAEYSRWKLE